MNGEMNVSAKTQKMFLKVIDHSPSIVTTSLNLSSCLHFLPHNSQKPGPGRVFMFATEEKSKGPMLTLVAV